LTASEAAAAAGVSERTVRRRLSDPEFKNLVDESRTELLDAALVRLTSQAIHAVDTLAGLMKPQEPPSVRLGAAKAILDFGLRLRAEGELGDRLSAIEDHLGMVG
jgi:AcrR family transcriptional regulator